MGHHDTTGISQNCKKQDPLLRVLMRHSRQTEHPHGFNLTWLDVYGIAEWHLEHTRPSLMTDRSEFCHETLVTGRGRLGAMKTDFWPTGGVLLAGFDLFGRTAEARGWLVWCGVPAAWRPSWLISMRNANKIGVTLEISWLGVEQKIVWIQKYPQKKVPKGGNLKYITSCGNLFFFCLT